MANQVQQAFDLFERIGATSSRNEKEEYLKVGKDNLTFKALLHFCYDPFINFYIKKEPKVESIGTATTDIKYGMFVAILGQLSSRQVTGNAAIEKVTQFFSICTPEEHKWYWAVLRKDLKIGITDKTINKVFPRLIPEFSCQLAHPLKKFPKLFVADRKLDGYRCLAFHFTDGRVELRTRNGNLIEGYTGIEADVALLPVGCVYDGEIMARTGTFNDTQKDVFKKGKNDKDGVLNIFDVVTVEDFTNGQSTAPLYQRIGALNDMDDIIQSAHSLARVAPSEPLTGETGVQRAYELHAQFTQEGFEGTMIKDLNATYKCKRSYDVQKIKDMDTLDLTVIDVLEGEAGTKYEGRLGALVVDFDGYAVNVGSGYTDAQRDDFWARRNDLINRTVEVKYQEVTSNQEGGKSLRFPVFMGFRSDK